MNIRSTLLMVQWVTVNVLFIEISGGLVDGIQGK